ncbi:MAG: amino acid permease [Nakamurella sp.]
MPVPSTPVLIPRGTDGGFHPAPTEAPYPYFLMRALGELVLHRQTSGAFVSHMREFYGEKAAYVTGWMYWLNWALTGIAELSAVAIYLQYGFPDLPRPITVLVALVVVLIINLLSERAFGEFEFWASVLTVGATVIFLAVGLVVVIGRFRIGDHHAGFQNLWSNPGGFWAASGAYNWYGPILVMSGVVFAYAAIEMVGVAAGEMSNPEREVPKAVNSVIFRIAVFYCGSILLLVSMLPATTYTAGTSPFVTVFAPMGLNWMGAMIRAVLIVAALSSLNSGLYSTGRVLRSLGMSKQAPAVTLKMSKSGVPWAGIVMTSVVYVLGAPFQMPGSPYTSYIGLVFLVLVLIGMAISGWQSSPEFWHKTSVIVIVIGIPVIALLLTIGWRVVSSKVVENTGGRMGPHWTADGPAYGSDDPALSNLGGKQ